MCIGYKQVLPILYKGLAHHGFGYPRGSWNQYPWIPKEDYSPIKSRTSKKQKTEVQKNLTIE